MLWARPCVAWLQIGATVCNAGDRMTCEIQSANSHTRYCIGSIVTRCLQLRLIIPSRRSGHRNAQNALEASDDGCMHAQ